MDKRKYKVGSVSYLNARPLIYGFEKGMMKDEIDLLIDYPSAIAAQLISGQIDIGLVPVAVIPQLPEAHIIADYCIGCDGEVATVCLFSEVLLHEISSILLDYQSRTSVALLKLLLKEHWHISPELIDAKPGYENDIGGKVAGLVIGDLAFDMHRKSAYSYDLGQAWKEMTGMPFVFAAWVSNKRVEEHIAEQFNMANAFGLENLDEVISTIESADVDMRKYFTENLSYGLDDTKRKALDLFLAKLTAGK